MKYPILLFLMVLISCDKNCEIPYYDCIDYSLIPRQNVKNSKDLERYLLKEDTTYFKFGETLFATAAKVVPSQGSILWKVNNNIVFYRGKYGLSLRNYADTSDWEFNFDWAYQREIISAEFDINKFGKQKLVNEETYLFDTTLLRSKYLKAADDGDVLDAIWQIDMAHESYIEITKIDWNKMIVEGNFDLYFKIDLQSTLPKTIYSDKAHFRCGKFRAAIQE